MNPYYPNQPGSFYPQNQQYPYPQPQYTQAGPFYGQGHQQGQWGMQQNNWSHSAGGNPWGHPQGVEHYPLGNPTWLGAQGPFLQNPSQFGGQIQQVFPTHPTGFQNFTPSQQPGYLPTQVPSLGGSYYSPPAHPQHNLHSVPPPGYPPTSSSMGNYSTYTLEVSAYPSAQQGANVQYPQQLTPPFSQFGSVNQTPRTFSEQQTSFRQVPASMNPAPAANQKKEVDELQLNNYFLRSIDCNAKGMDTLIADIERQQGDMKEAYLKALLEYWSHEKNSIQYKKIAEELGIEALAPAPSSMNNSLVSKIDTINEEALEESSEDYLSLSHKDFLNYLQNLPDDQSPDYIITERVTEAGHHMSLEEFSDLYCNIREYFYAETILKEYLKDKDQATHILEDLLNKVGGYDTVIQSELLKLAKEEDKKNSIYDRTKTKEFTYLKQFVNHPNCKAEDYQYEIYTTTQKNKKIQDSDLKSYIIKEGLDNWSPEKNEEFLPILGLNDEASHSRYITKPRELLAAAEAARTQAEAVDKNSEAYKQDPAHTSICKGLLEKLEGLTKDSTTLGSIITCLQTIKTILNNKYNEIDLKHLQYGVTVSYNKNKASLQKVLGSTVFTDNKELLAELMQKHESISDYEKNTMKYFIEKYNDTVRDLANIHKESLYDKNTNYALITSFLIEA